MAGEPLTEGERNYGPWRWGPRCLAPFPESPPASVTLSLRPPWLLLCGSCSPCPLPAAIVISVLFQEVIATLSVGEEDTQTQTGNTGPCRALDVCEKGITLYVLGPSL